MSSTRDLVVALKADTVARLQHRVQQSDRMRGRDQLALQCATQFIGRAGTAPRPVCGTMAPASWLNRSVQGRVHWARSFGAVISSRPCLNRRGCSSFQFRTRGLHDLTPALDFAGHEFAEIITPLIRRFGA